jgi:SWI/SNF-related matrix-associated actin-dependent regulator of chromatin subfamily D
VLGGQAPDTIPFVHLPELVNRYLSAPDPVLLHYAFDPAQAPAERPAAWDVEVRVEDAALRAKMAGLAIGAAHGTARELARLDDEVRARALLSLSIL